MKIQNIKQALLRELDTEYRKDTNVTLRFTEEDAQKFGVSLPALDSILSSLSDEGLIARQYNGQWQITVAGREWVEEDDGGEIDSDPTLRQRLEQVEERVKALEELCRKAFST